MIAFSLSFVEVDSYIPALTLTFLCILTTGLILRYFKGNKRNLPPMPYGVPFLGHVQIMYTAEHKKFVEISKTYGNVFRLQLMGKFTVVLNDEQQIKEAYDKPAFLGSGIESFSDILPDGAGLFQLDGAQWVEQRKFFLKSLKTGEFAPDKLSEHFREGIQEFLVYLEKMDGKALDFYSDITSSLSNIILSLTVHRRFDNDHPTAVMLKTASQDFVSFFQSAELILLPLIRKLTCYFIKSFRNKLNSSLEMNKFFRQQLVEHKKDIDRNNPRDFTDRYLIEIENHKKIADTTFTEGMLVSMVQMLYLLGIVDIRSSLFWIMLCMAEYQDVQRRVQDEIDNLIGNNRFPTWEDHCQMPFTEAVIRETLRWKPTNPIGSLRRTLEDTSVDGYFVPKDSLACANLWWILNNPKYWKDPEKFLPERHIGEDGKSLVYHEHYYPFSYGKRQCPGEKFAQMELFLYTTAVLQRYVVKMPEGKVADFTEIRDLNTHPKHQDICFIPR